MRSRPRSRATICSRVRSRNQVSLLDAAAHVLNEAAESMRVKAIVEAVIELGLWQPGTGKTPHATLYAAMTGEIATKGDATRFRKADRGLFESTRNGG